MSALKSDLKQAKEVPFFLNQLCLILPEEIEKFTKRKIKERVSAFKAVSGLDMPLDLIRKEKSLEENLDLENQAANESSSDESKAKILPFKRLGENLQDISATEPTKKVIEPDRDYELERLENELKATTEETSGALSTLGIKSKDHLEKIKAIEDRKKKNKELSPSQFLISEREKLKEKNKSLKKSECDQSYKKVAHMHSAKNKTDDEIEAGKDIEQESGLKGILLNKKVY